MPLAQLSLGFQSLPPLLTNKLGPFDTDSHMAVSVYDLEHCGSYHHTSMRLGASPAPSFPTTFHNQSFESFLSCSGTLGCAVCPMSQLFLPVYPQANVGPPVCQLLPPTPVPHLLPCQESSPPQLPVSALPTGLDKCFFFNSSVVGLPYSSIFWQLWLVFSHILLFKYSCLHFPSTTPPTIVVFLLVARRGTRYLPMPPSWLEVHKCI